jgi:DNA-nicking Smr family endonuclease
MPKSPPPSDDDDVFRAEMAADGVVPIEVAPRAELVKPRPKPIAVKHLQDEAAVPLDSLKHTSDWDVEVDTGDLISFLRPGLPNEVLRKLRRGQWIVQATLDLHGHTVDAARVELARFLAEARRAGIRCVAIVHGKGYRSPQGVSVLRDKVRLSLSRRDEVLAFCDAAPADGGGGAVMVLLRAS